MEADAVTGFVQGERVFRGRQAKNSRGIRKICRGQGFASVERASTRRLEPGDN
jgi:hypothetical protein